MDGQVTVDREGIYIPITIEVLWDDIEEMLRDDVPMVFTSNSSRHVDLGEIEATPEQFDTAMREGVDVDEGAKVAAAFFENGDFYELPIYRQIVDAIASTFDEDAFEDMVVSNALDAYYERDAVDTAWAMRFR